MADQNIGIDLESYQGDAGLAFGSGFAGGMPLSLNTPKTDAALTAITQNTINRRKKDFDDFQKNIEVALTSISDTDGIYEVDQQVIRGKQKDLYKYIIENADAIAPMSSVKNPQRYAEFKSRLSSFMMDVDKSKQDKKLEQQYQQLIRQKPEYNNEATRKLWENWRNEGPSRLPFAGVPDGEKELLEAEKQYYKDLAGAEVTIVEEPIPNDPMSYTVMQKAKYNMDDYRDRVFLPQKTEFIEASWAANPELRIKYNDDKQAYIDDLVKQRFGSGERVLASKIQNRTNQSELEAGRNQRANNALALRREISDRQLNLAEYKQEYKESQDRLKAIEENASSMPLMQNVIKRLGDAEVEQDLTSVGKKFIPNAKSIFELKSTTIPDDVKSYLYEKGEGGRSAFGEAYGKVYKIETSDGREYYAPAKRVFILRGKEVDKKDYDAAVTDNKSIRSVIDNNRIFTKETLALRSIEGTQKGREEVANYNKTYSSTPKSSGSGFLKSAEKYKNVKYKIGAKGDDGNMDCSGIVCAILNDNGIKASGTSEEIVANAPQKINASSITSINDFKEGDVIGVDTGATSFDKGRKNGIDHVGIVVEKDGRKYFVESRLGKGYDMTPLEDKWNKYAKSGYGIFVGRYGGGDSQPVNSGAKKKYKFNPKTSKLELQ
jgi:cell wall-associated NlpC family hydrolase